MCTIGLGISLTILWFSHYVLGLTSPLADNISANIVGLGAGSLFRFWAYRRFVFTHESTVARRRCGGPRPGGHAASVAPLARPRPALSPLTRVPARAPVRTPPARGNQIASVDPCRRCPGGGRRAPANPPHFAPPPSDVQKSCDTRTDRATLVAD